MHREIEEQHSLHFISAHADGKTFSNSGGKPIQTETLGCEIQMYLCIFYLSRTNT